MTDLSQEIARRNSGRGDVAPAGPATLEALLGRMAPEFGKVLPRALPPDTFLRLALNELRATPQLAHCTQQSFLGSLMLAARLGLEPGGPLGQLYLTPRRLQVPGAERGTRALQVVPIIGYRGLRDLAIRSGKVDSIQSFIVREGDGFHFGADQDRGAWFVWEPAETDEDESDRPWKGVVTIANLGVGKKPVWRYLSKSAVLKRKASGDAGDRGPWKDHEEAMVRKTGIRAIANDLPSSSVLLEAVRSDERVTVWQEGDDRPRQLEQAPDAPDDEPAPDAPQPQQQEQPAPRRGRGKAAAPEAQGQYAPPPPDAPPMADYGDADVEVQDPPEDGPQ